MKRLFDILSVFLLITGIMVLGESIIYPQPSEYGPATLNWGPNVKYSGTFF
ncbi:MAG: hypothetical protein OH335_05020 [Candidatus Parvarchaeota archaeon]|nr:hypothetical protein [Candidatus Jingweiarchaeum tengchongense]